MQIFESIYIGKVDSKDGESFSAYMGLDSETVGQLKNLSLDESDTEIQNYTSDRKRFGEGRYEDWYAKDRTPFALIEEKTNVMAALVWLGPMLLPGKSGNWNTIAWRAYPKFRGRGLMKRFTRLAIEKYKDKFPDVKIFAKIDKDNQGSIMLGQALGFKEFSSDDQSIIMTYE